MKKLLDTTPTFYTPAKANEICATLNADKHDDWTYESNNPDGSKGNWAQIIIKDESGNEVGRF
jgi:hypothetical protein